MCTAGGEPVISESHILTSSGMRPVTAGARRLLHSSAPRRMGIEEFFGPTYAMSEDGKPTRAPAGRAWRVSELRGKSYEDLHKLWWVCLKEKNMLLTDRLYYGQVGVEMPDAARYSKVRRTMAGIKHVLGERSRAIGSEFDARDLRPEPLPELQGEPVELKKFGRKLTVPSDHPYAQRPTQAEIKDHQRRQRYWGRRRAREEAARRAKEEAEAKTPEDVRSWYAEREAGRLARTSIEGSLGEAVEDKRFASEESEIQSLRRALEADIKAAAAKRSRGGAVTRAMRRNATMEGDEASTGADGTKDAGSGGGGGDGERA